MADKQKFTVIESVRFAGTSYITGDPIELTAEEAAELAGFVEPAAQKAAPKGPAEKDAKKGGNQ